MIKLVVSDLDGTLLDYKKEVPAGLYSLIEQLSKRNIIFSVASGRSSASIRSYFKESPAAIIANNGSVVYSAEQELLFTADFSYEKAAPIIELVRNSSYMHIALCGVNYTYVQDDEPKEHKEFVNYYFNNQVKIVKKLQEAFEIDKITKISINTGANGRNENRVRELMKNFEGNFATVLSGDGWVDLMEQGISKGSALLKLCEHYKIKAEETIVFGDYINDLDMLKQTPNSYAMANAHSDVKKACNYITQYTNDEEGVIRELKRILEIN